MILKHACKFFDTPPIKRQNLGSLPLKLGRTLWFPQRAECARSDTVGLPRSLPMFHRNTLNPCEKSCHPEVAAWRYHEGRPDRERLGNLQIPTEESLKRNADSTSLRQGLLIQAQLTPWLWAKQMIVPVLSHCFGVAPYAVLNYMKIKVTITNKEWNSGVNHSSSTCHPVCDLG